MNFLKSTFYCLIADIPTGKNYYINTELIYLQAYQRDNSYLKSERRKDYYFQATLRFLNTQDC